ncbi:hypothetical protein KBC70_00505 [Candidatus Woesebacteria bacterium]|nr:hypothetical protein [Candidatus Woesebacteria bacterium]
MQSIVRVLRMDFQDFATLSPQVRFLLMFQIIVLFLLSILIGLIFSPKFKNSVQMRSGASLDTVPTSTPQVKNILKLQAEKPSMVRGTSQTITVFYNGAQSEAVDTIVQYDPAVIRVDKIKNLGMFDTVLQSKVAPQRVVFSAGMSLDALEKNSFTPGQLFSFTVTALQPVERTPLSFVEPESYVWHSTQNIVTSFENVTLEIVAQ